MSPDASGLESEGATEKILEDPGYRSKAGTASEIKRHAELDQEYFGIPEEPLAEESLPEKERELEIWSLTRSCSTLCRANSDTLEVVRKALQQCAFYENHEAYGNGYVHKRYNVQGKDKACN